jgi:hypothetical protein
LAIEQTLYKTLQDNKAKIDADYTATFKENIDEQAGHMNLLITKY